MVVSTASRTSNKAQTSRRSTTINLRVPEPVRDLIDAAAEAAGKTRTEFMLESARRNAIDVLLDQRLFVLAPEEWDAFMAALERPAAPNDELRKLMAMKPPWET